MEVSNLQADFTHLNIPLQAQTSSQLSLPISSISPCSNSWSKRILWQTKALLTSRQTIYTALPSSTWPVTSPKFNQSVKYELPLVKPCWLFVMIFMSLMCLELVLRLSCFITFLQNKVRVTRMEFSGSSPSCPSLREDWHFLYSSLHIWDHIFTTFLLIRSLNIITTFVNDSRSHYIKCL